MAVIKNKRILKYLLMIVVSLFLILNFSIGVSASGGYDRQEADACITISQRLSVKTSYGKSSGNFTKPKGWKVGDPIDNLTKAGNEPSWSTVRARYWKNKAYYYADDYLESDLIRMRKGQAPLHSKYNVPMELHHINGRDIANPNSIENLQEVWLWEHDLIDEFRHYTGPKPEGY